jgi:sensor histidine kinase regulating citrate/malate metabolism
MTSIFLIHCNLANVIYLCLIVIILGRLRQYTTTDIRKAVMGLNETIATESNVKQFITYLPDEDEVNKTIINVFLVFFCLLVFISTQSSNTNSTYVQ